MPKCSTHESWLTFKWCSFTSNCEWVRSIRRQHHVVMQDMIFNVTPIAGSMSGKSVALVGAGLRTATFVLGLVLSYLVS